MKFRSFHIPSYILFPFVAFICISFAMGFQFYEINTSDFYQKIKKSDVICSEIILILDLMTLSLLHYISLVIFCYPKKQKYQYPFLKYFQQPTIVINLVFGLYYGFILFITIFDVECTREMQAHVSVNHFQTYIFRPQPIFSQVLYRNGIKGGSGGIEVLISSLKYSVTHWVLFILGYAIILITCLVFLILNWKIFCKSFVSSESLDKQAQQQQLQDLVNDVQQIQKIQDTFINNEEEIDDENEEEQQQQIQSKQKVNVKFITEKTLFLQIYRLICILSSIVTLSIFIYYLQQNGLSSINRYVPSHWRFFYSVVDTKMSEQEISQTIQDYVNRLPAGRYQLDAKNYPLVTGTYEQYCSFNDCKLQKQQITNKNSNINQTVQNITKIINDTIQYEFSNNQTEQDIPPNILFLTYESFSPVPKYLKDEFISDPQLIKNGSPYNTVFLPNIDNLAQKGTTFLGTTSKSLPTVAGWWSLNYGESASLKGLNMQRSVDNNIDSFTEKIHKLGYYTTYLSPSDYKFDGKINWIFNNYQTFDEVWYMVPDKEWKNILNVDSNKNSWIGDRVTANEMIFIITMQMLKTGRTNISYASKMYAQAVGLNIYQAEYYIRQQLSIDLSDNKYQPKKNQPLYWQYFNVDTHFSFIGYDNKKQYNRFRQNGDDDYTVMIKSSDYHFGRIIDYIQKFDNNTIIYLVGDHGNRIQMYNTKQEIGNGTQAYFDKQCYQKITGNDDMFTTSSIIAYLNESIAHKLNTSQYINQTYAGFSDHDDFIVTLEQQVYNLNNQTQPPTSREYINLFDILKGQQYNKLSVSNTQQVFEIKNKNKLFRGSRYGSTNSLVIENVIYPSCIVYRKQEGDDKNNLYNNGIQFVRLNNYLAEHNRIWNDKFYNISCKFNPVTGEGIKCQNQSENKKLKSQLNLSNNKNFLHYQTDKQLLAVIFVCLIPFPFAIILIVCKLNNKPNHDSFFHFFQLLFKIEVFKNILDSKLKIPLNKIHNNENIIKIQSYLEENKQFALCFVEYLLNEQIDTLKKYKNYINQHASEQYLEMLCQQIRNIEVKDEDQIRIIGEILENADIDTEIYFYQHNIKHIKSIDILLELVRLLVQKEDVNTLSDAIYDMKKSISRAHYYEIQVYALVLLKEYSKAQLLINSAEEEFSQIDPHYIQSLNYQIYQLIISYQLNVDQNDQVQYLRKGMMLKTLIQQHQQKRPNELSYFSFLYQFMGKFFEDAENYQSAFNCYCIALNLKSSNSYAKRKIVQLLQSLKILNLALKYLSQCPQNNFITLYQLAVDKYMRQDYDNAEYLLKRCIKQNKYYSQSKILLGIVYMKQKQLDLSIKTLQQIDNSAKKGILCDIQKILLNTYKLQSGQLEDYEQNVQEIQQIAQQMFNEANLEICPIQKIDNYFYQTNFSFLTIKQGIIFELSKKQIRNVALFNQKLNQQSNEFVRQLNIKDLQTKIENQQNVIHMMKQKPLNIACLIDNFYKNSYILHIQFLLMYLAFDQKFNIKIYCCQNKSYSEMCDLHRYLLPQIEKYVQIINMFDCFQKEENKIYPIQFQMAERIKDEKTAIILNFCQNNVSLFNQVCALKPAPICIGVNITNYISKNYLNYIDYTMESKYLQEQTNMLECMQNFILLDSYPICPLFNLFPQIVTQDELKNPQYNNFQGYIQLTHHNVFTIAQPETHEASQPYMSFSQEQQSHYYFDNYIMPIGKTSIKQWLLLDKFDKVFGCFSAFEKFDSIFIDIICQLLNKYQNSCILFQSTSQYSSTNIRNTFMQKGIMPERIRFLEIQDYLNTIKYIMAVDIYLDTLKVASTFSLQACINAAVPYVSLQNIYNEELEVQQLNCNNIDQYNQLIDKLYNDKTFYQQIVNKLIENRVEFQNGYQTYYNNFKSGLIKSVQLYLNNVDKMNSRSQQFRTFYIKSQSDVPYVQLDCFLQEKSLSTIYDEALDKFDYDIW